MSFLRSHGHPAQLYTPWQVEMEALLLREHLLATQAHQAALIQAAIGSCLDKKAAQAFAATLGALLDPDS